MPSAASAAWTREALATEPAAAPDIVVTAQRRKENQQDVPVSLQAPRHPTARRARDDVTPTPVNGERPLGLAPCSVLPAE